MLRVAKVRKGGHAYYLEVAGNGVGTGIEAPGVWLGTGAAALGLRGEVEGDALGAVLAGDDPVTSRRLGRSHDRVTVAGFDLSFCAPKSVSMLHALGPTEIAHDVRAAHVAAVDAALDYVERRAVAVRRPSGGRLVPVEAQAVRRPGSCIGSVAPSTRICTVTWSWPTWAAVPTARSPPSTVEVSTRTRPPPTRSTTRNSATS